MVALHARHTAVVITAEDTVIASPAALLKTRISEALLRRDLAAIKALAPGAAESASLAAAESAITPQTGRPPRDWHTARRAGVPDYAPTPNCPAVLLRGNAGTRNDERKNGR